MFAGLGANSAAGMSVPGLNAGSTIKPPSAMMEMLEKWLPAELLNNPIFSGGCGLFGIGFAAALLRGSFGKARQIAERRLLTSLEIPSKDHSYRWVMQWLTKHCTNTRHLGLETTFSRDSAGNVKTAFTYVPSTGKHWVRYKSSLLLIRRERETSAIDLQSGTPWETLTITTAAFQRKIVASLLEEARQHAVKDEEGRTIIFHSVGQDWRPFGSPKRVRPFASVILDGSIAEEIHADILDFLSSDQWYFDRGIPYRRGYLLHGPPGCGKSSYVSALAGQLRYNICVVNVSDPYLTDDRLNYLLATVPPKSLVLLEDIDGAVAAQEAEAAEKDPLSSTAIGTNTTFAGVANPAGFRRQVTFSGLLNALDGVAATEERLIFMTTNHLDRLPASLIRPGRVDVSVAIGYATGKQIERMFLRFFPERTSQAIVFSEILSSHQLTMAELQGFFMRCKTMTAKDALRLGRGWAVQKATAEHMRREATSTLKESEEKIKQTISPK